MIVPVKVGDGRDYDIRIKDGLLSEVVEEPIFKKYSKKLILTDENVFRHYQEFVKNPLFDDYLVLPAGEETKSFIHLQSILDKMVSMKLDRKSLVIIFGGGVIGDLGGFAASMYMRGLDFIQIPTTLLSQVDSSVGGKTAINHPGGKNLIGTFYQPKLVLIDPQVLKTLPVREFKAGLGEVVKYGVIWDAEFFEYLVNNAKEILSYQKDVMISLIARCCEIKAEVVSQDERENGIRAILNYGHSVAHGIENVFQYQNILHGEAVIFGMDVEMRLACKRGLILEKELAKQIHLMEKLSLGFPLASFEMKNYLQAITLDKKNSNNLITFILPTALGEVKSFTDIRFAEIEDATKLALKSPLFS